nr:MAG TPA: hypothetical protein [Microviridae sp.]
MKVSPRLSARNPRGELFIQKYLSYEIKPIIDFTFQSIL